MITFLDGPAAGRTLAVRRAKFFLRVTFDGKKWDCLNEMWDEAAAAEKLFVYILTEKPTAVHIKGRTRADSGWYAMARYRFLARQPADADIRANANWRRWCFAEADLLDQWKRLFKKEAAAEA